MAQRGHGVVIGNGNCRTNPIHDSDAARACVDSLRPGPLEMPAGGPVVYTRREIVELAFGALNRNPIIHSVPTWALAPLPFLMRAANRRIAGLVEFGTVVSTVDCTAAHYGDRNLEDYFREAASALASSGRQPEGKEAQRRGNTVSA
ncbi:MAG: hypothetical protein H7Y20_11155 [Bryobacteraceae bacterium]|nr:hypothetical protein [Bryobacteraceae bacterium]